MIFDYFANNHDKFLYLLGGLSLVIELSVMGLSGPLLFFGLSCGLTGFLVHLGFLSSWELEALTVGFLSLGIAAVSWKPLKAFQGSGRVSDQSSDMIGQIVPVSEEVTISDGAIRHSGINWQARLSDSLSSEAVDVGTRVKITGVEGNVMLVSLMDE